MKCRHLRMGIGFLPLFEANGVQAAQMVNIAVIDPPQHGPERSDPGGMLCQMLVRHGVKAEVSVLARSMPRISRASLAPRNGWSPNGSPRRRPAAT